MSLGTVSLKVGWECLHSIVVSLLLQVEQLLEDINPIYESEVSVIEGHTGINSPIGFAWWSLPSNEKNLQKLGFSMVKWQSEKICKEQLFNNFHFLLHAIPLLEDQRVSYFSFMSLTFHLLSFLLCNTI